MAKKRPEFSFPELEQRGRNAILRSSAEVEAEEALLAKAGAGGAPATAPASAPSASGVTPVTPGTAPRRGAPKRPAATVKDEPAHDDVRARTHARTHAPKAGFPADLPTAVIDRLRQKLQSKQHLSSYTFRFRAEELEQLDGLVSALNQDRGVKLSKNDLMRLALSWLLTDYEQYGLESLVAEVTRQE
jgi:hypothetical protein